MFKTLEDGIAMVRTGVPAEACFNTLILTIIDSHLASDQGDPRFRLEKYLADIVCSPLVFLPSTDIFLVHQYGRI